VNLAPGRRRGRVTLAAMAFRSDDGSRHRGGRGAFGRGNQKVGERWVCGEEGPQGTLIVLRSLGDREIRGDDHAIMADSVEMRTEQGKVKG
jgi:hypothetical protein